MSSSLFCFLCLGSSVPHHHSILYLLCPHRSYIAEGSYYAHALTVLQGEYSRASEAFQPGAQVCISDLLGANIQRFRKTQKLLLHCILLGPLRKDKINFGCWCLMLFQSHSSQTVLVSCFHSRICSLRLPETPALGLSHNWFLPPLPQLPCCITVAVSSAQRPELNAAHWGSNS